MNLSYFDALWYTVFPPDSALELIIDQLPDIVVELSKKDALVCGFMIMLSLGLTVLVCIPFDMWFNKSQIFEVKSVRDFLKSIAYFPVVVVVGALVLWIPIKLFGRIIGYLVYPFEWIASFILGIVYTVVNFFL